MRPNEKGQLVVKLAPEMRERLRVLGAVRRRTPHWLMCEAIRQYVEREDAVERALGEDRERLARYDATGEYVSGKDVVAWLETWGTPRERRVPRRIRRIRG